jgi:hypothetical protein
MPINAQGSIWNGHNRKENYKHRNTYTCIKYLAKFLLWPRQSIVHNIWRY